MDKQDVDKLERIHNRACDIMATASAILLILCVLLLVWWFALAVTP